MLVIDCHLSAKLSSQAHSSSVKLTIDGTNEHHEEKYVHDRSEPTQRRYLPDYLEPTSGPKKNSQLFIECRVNRRLAWLSSSLVCIVISAVGIFARL